MKLDEKLEKEERQYNAMDPMEKALKINLDPKYYGTFAEIGAGQEVANYFFSAGGAAGTVAKTMSAYDMVFSDAIYGKETSGRYVVESRLLKMLAREFQLLERRLTDKRPLDNQFFVFANTVAATSFKNKGPGHGWLGVRFQHGPRELPSQVILHVRMLDEENLLQQKALGRIGVNLMYSCFYYRDNIDFFILSLLDHLGNKRMEVDMIKTEGPAFEHMDNRLLALQLVRLGLTNAILFGASGDVLIPSEVFYKKNILALRGSFRPPTLVNMNMLETGVKMFMKEPQIEDHNTVVVSEITLNSLKAAGEYQNEDFLARVDILAGLGQKILVSNYQEYYRLASYLGRYTKNLVGIILGHQNLIDIFNEKYYDHLAGGILEAFGILFNRNLKMYLYPSRSSEENFLHNSKNFTPPKKLKQLYLYLLNNGFITDIEGIDESVLSIFSRDVLKMIQEDKSGWESMVPPYVAKVIKEKCLFDYPCQI